MGEVSLSSFATLGDAGIAGVVIAFLYFGFNGFKLIVKQWENSTNAMKGTTEAINRNSQSFESLSIVFEKQSIREVEFQKEVLSRLTEGQAIMNDTHTKVSDLHRKTFIQEK